MRFIRRALTALVPAAGMMAGSPVWAHSEETHEDVVDYENVEEYAFGKASNPQTAARTIVIDMSDDMRFSPSEITVQQGETVRFVIQNKGQQLHEMVLGTLEDLITHAELMKKFPGMEHSEPYMAHVALGGTEEIGWRFTRPGEYYYGCLIPGHFDAGMKGRILVQ